MGSRRDLFLHHKHLSCPPFHRVRTSHGGCGTVSVLHPRTPLPMGDRVPSVWSAWPGGPSTSLVRNVAIVGGELWGLETIAPSLLLCTILGVEPAPVAQARVVGRQALGFRGPRLVYVIQPTKLQVSNGDNVRASHWMHGVTVGCARDRSGLSCPPGGCGQGSKGFEGSLSDHRP